MSVGSRKRRGSTYVAAQLRPGEKTAGGSTAAASPRQNRTRIAGVDALRGVALGAMIAYHFCFDLRYFGLIRADFEHDPFWLGARTLILSSFLLIAGVSLALADRTAHMSTKFWRHVAIIALGALAVSGASYALFPRSYIWFGVLHAIAVSLVLARPLVPLPRAALAIGILVIAAGLGLSHPAFDNRTLGWLGFMTAKPSTEDYVPLFPWVGVLLCGVALGHAQERIRVATAPLAAAPAWFLWAGRHTLAIYLLHQPLLLGALWLFVRTRGV
jgi:uncharacterized membrane protein